MRQNVNGIDRRHQVPIERHDATKHIGGNRARQTPKGR